MVDTMTPEEKAGQLFWVRFPETGWDELAREWHPGGFLLFGRDFKNRTPEELRTLLASLQETSPIPLLLGVDEEGGTVVRASYYPAFRAEKFRSPQALFAAGGLEAVRADALDKPSAVLTGSFLKRIDNCSRSVLNQNSRSFSFMSSVCYPQVHSCMQTSGVFRNLRIFVQITKNSGVFTFVMTYSAVLPCGYTSCIFCEIRWRIAVNKVQTCFSAHTARTAALRHRKSIGIINSRALTSAYDLFSFPAILAVAFSESQYFSGTVDSKTSCNVNSFSDLGKVIGAVIHTPFHAIPQLRKRFNDFCKSFSRVNPHETGYVFKAKILRSFRFKQSGKLKEQISSLVGKAFSCSADRERLAGETSNKEIKVCKFSDVNISDIFIKLFTSGIVQCFVGFLRKSVNLAPPHNFKSSDSFQSRSEASDA